LHGFTDAHDYYQRSSSMPFLATIRCPTLLLSAFDDPFLPPEVLHEVQRIAATNPFLTAEFHARGGHVGFVSGRSPLSPRYYAEDRIFGFLRPFVESTQ
jgi:predicted alpha/beta-fold hydrolase